MTKRERVMRALSFEPTDRTPVVGGFLRRPDILARVADATVDQFWQSPRQTAISAFRRLGVDIILALILPDKDSATGAEVAHKRQNRFHTPEEVRDYVASLPPPSSVAARFNHQAAREEYRRIMDLGQQACGEIVWVPNGIGRYCVNFDYSARFGYENYVMALTLYPDVMERLFAHDGERAFLTNRAVAEATGQYRLVPVVFTGSDACDNRGPFVKPDIMERIYFPHLQRTFQPLREAGITIVWHSDGYITPIAGSLLRAGADGFQGLQEKTPTCIKVAELDALRTLSGRRPVFIGSISSTVTMPFGTPEDVRAEVNRWQRFAEERGGGVLLNSTSSLGPEVPEENIRAFFEAGTLTHGPAGKKHRKPLLRRRVMPATDRFFK